MNINEYMISKSYKPDPEIATYFKAEKLDPLYIKACIGKCSASPKKKKVLQRNAKPLPGVQGA